MSGRGSPRSATGRRHDRLGERRPGGGRRRAERGQRRRDVPPGDDRQPGLGEAASTRARARALGGTAARQEERDDARAAPAAAVAGRAARAATDRAAGRPRRRRSTRRRPRTRRDGRAPPARRGPAAGPGRATARRRPRRTRRRTRRARSARRRAGRRCGGVGRSRCWWSTAGAPERDGPAAVDEESTAAGWGRLATSGRGAARTSHLIGGLAVDGQVQAHLLDLRLDPDAEQDVDDLDDDDGPDDRVAGRSRRPRRPG